MGPEKKDGKIRQVAQKGGPVKGGGERGEKGAGGGGGGPTAHCTSKIGNEKTDVTPVSGGPAPGERGTGKEGDEGGG